MIELVLESMALYAILGALISYGVYNVLTAETNPAHTSRLGNVRAPAISTSEPRPTRFALEDDMDQMGPRNEVPPPGVEPIAIPSEEETAEEEEVDAPVQVEEPEPEPEQEVDAESLLEEIGKEWQLKAGSTRTETTLDDVSGEAVKNPDLSEFQERLDREGAQTGQVQVSLIWDNKNDLDLSIVCPSGERISFDNKTSRCGGLLDVDMNEAPTSEEPVENIFWPPNSAPPGEYRVYVEHFEQHAEQDLTNFRILVNDGKKSKEFKGEITNDEPPKLVCVFTIE
ncbi:MAG: hypothetical protein VX320_00020 [Candidatus Thermoplasmatota archaeon]|nr:hypothetical protein [Candidatus Thermoplasmatota archaeon]